jgi:hypothetical protein
MTSSGTYGATTIEVADIMDHVMRRVGLNPGLLSAEIIITIKNNLFMFLSTLSNRGINLWKINRPIIGVYPGETDYTLPVGTLDVLESLHRTPQQLSGTVTSSAGGTVGNLTDQNTATACAQSAPNGNFRWDFGVGSTQNVPLVGLLPSGNQTLNLVCETSPDGVTWTTSKTLGSVAYVDNQWTWFEIDPATPTQFFRIRETAGGTMVFREIFLSNTWSEISMYRMNRTDYAMLPNKKTPGRPLQFWLDRQITPVMRVWQNPTAAFAFTCIALFLHQQIQDVGAIGNTLDIPQRWYDSVIANIAFMSILDIPGADMTRYPILKDQAGLAMTMADAEERDASPTNWHPNIQPYTM